MFSHVTLELSLKPFKQTDPAYIQAVCQRIFAQWRPLLKDRDTLSVLLWAGDGSELLDYNGALDTPFEWCRYVGTANKPLLEENAPKETSLHLRKQDYIPHPPVMTYRILKEIVSCLKEEGKKAFPNATLRVGETFDIGPEFAVSDFKYRRHPELCSGSRLDGLGFIDATATLYGDMSSYAAYPQGIPEGLPFGTFLGKQAEIFLREMGFDYLWLSNGLGFSANPWDKTGKIFDGDRYYPEKLEETKRKVFEFWQLFRKECSFPLETRGTNNSAGIDYATDGVPLHALYNANLNITAPPNSPWAAINDNFGLEMMGHMTRICELPNERFPFRYYLHDPWWINSPWYDRYDGSPCDIYLPMAISRITAKGRVETANSLNLLSIDNSYGELPDQCVNEPLPHLLKAEKNAPDAPAPLVWVYPMREYTTTKDPALLKEMNEGDLFISQAINQGLPLCCVVSTDSFLQHKADLYQKSILLSPVPENPAVLQQLNNFAARGIPVFFYGTEEKLASLPHTAPRLNVHEDPALWKGLLATAGQEISHRFKQEGSKPPAMAISRRDNGLFFSVYNPNTTTDTCLKFPLGAPILCGGEAELLCGAAVYRFARGEHRECRVFAEQQSGVISCRETAPVNARFRRALRITGLEDATLRLFPEEGCEAVVSIAKNTDRTPEFDPRFTLVTDPAHGTYLQGEHINGSLYFLMGRKS